MSEELRFKKVNAELNAQSGSFCLAKWLQVTIHLQNGLTHSCHHPPTHKIPLSEIQSDPSALHNTAHKKQQRKLMKEGVRPGECDYCWKIEDASPENLSDRTYKSADEWAYPHFQEVATKPWDTDIDPTYVEVSFGNECQFKCAYCSPGISSGILSEYMKHGHYEVQPYLALDTLKANNQYPYSKDEFNPYVDAFWKWWPRLSKKLEVFRITGGEPLLNPNTFRFLEHIIAEPMPKLDLAINSNLCVPDSYINKFIDLTKQIVADKKVKKFEVYTSLDTYGAQAEYIRFGLDFEKFIKNVRSLLESVPEMKIVFMCTFNALSVPGFEKFLKLIHDLKLDYKANEWTSRIELSIPYLRHPQFMAASILTEDYIPYVEKSLDYMLRNAKKGDFNVFSEYEISMLRRLLEWMKNNSYSDFEKGYMRKHFYSFFKEYDRRKGTSFKKTFPEFDTFMEFIEKTYITDQGV